MGRCEREGRQADQAPPGASNYARNHHVFASAEISYIICVMAVFKVGLIGGGVISGAHVAAAKASGGRVVVGAIVDPIDSARRKVIDATNGDAKAYASVEELLGSESRERTLDGVMICTPPSVRLAIVRAALERGLAVFVEKPI